MELEKIETEGDYPKALKKLEMIFDAKRGTTEGAELEKLADLIVEYESIFNF